MGAVYECENITVGKRCAIKILDRRESLPPEAMERFNREATAPSKIAHRNVVEMHDAGIEPDGTPWMVMELLEGETLQEVLRREGVIQPDKLMALMDPLLDCLEQMHVTGFVHRDLKPPNIFLAGDPADPTVKLLDFGIAKALGEESRTRSGYVIGTPAYMSPEQMRNARGATARSDLWSVGVMLFEALVGYRPFRGETFALLAQIAGPDPSPRLARVAPHLGREIADLVDRCLSKDLAKRPASAAMLRAELRVALAKCGRARRMEPPEDGESSQEFALGDEQVAHTLPASSHQPAAEGVSAHKSRGLLGLAAVFCLFASGALVIGWLGNRGPTRPPARPPVATTRTPSSGALHAVAADGTRALGHYRELQDALRSWQHDVIESRGRGDSSPYYVDHVQFHGSNGLSAPAAIRRYWSELFSRSSNTLRFDWARTRVREREANLTEVPAACINVAGARGAVYEVRAQATEYRADRHPDIGCAELSGVYLMRLRRIDRGYKICHESWSLREGICSSCPTARVCQGTSPDP